jgi:hypothetical protein
LPAPPTRSFILANGPQGPTLYGKGRDIEEIETALRFDRARGLWTALGDATEFRRTDERKAILDALRERVVTLCRQQRSQL